MKKELFKSAMITLISSWGGGTPPEAIWAANDFIEYFNSLNNCNLSLFEEEDPDFNKFEQELLLI